MNGYYEIRYQYEDFARYKKSENVYCRYQGSFAKAGDLVTEEFELYTNKPVRVELIGEPGLKPVLVETFNYHGKILIIKFIMPSKDISIKLTEEEINMDPNETKIVVDDSIIDRFEIPDELARELSDLLTKQTIRERLLTQLTGEPDKFESVEKMLMPITARIEAIKVKITREYVPPRYRNSQYTWSYDGYEVDGNLLQIILTSQMH